MAGIVIEIKRNEPSLTRPCYEAIWSAGRSCLTCPVSCYRAGWNRSRVQGDMQRLELLAASITKAEDGR